MTNLQQSAQALSRLMLLLALQMTGVIVFFIWGAFSAVNPDQEEIQSLENDVVGQEVVQQKPKWFPNGDLNEGKRLFLSYCASCHAVDMKKDLTGPALRGLKDRWADFPEEELFRWIRETQDILNDPEAKSYNYANALYISWNKARMNSFGDFTDQEIQSILNYIDQ